MHCLDLNAQGRICAIRPMADGEQRAGVSWGGDWVSPRGIDLQINGGLGLAFPELTDGDLPRLLELLELLQLLKPNISSRKRKLSVSELGPSAKGKDLKKKYRILENASKKSKNG